MPTMTRIEYIFLGFALPQLYGLFAYLLWHTCGKTSTAHRLGSVLPVVAFVGELWCYVVATADAQSSGLIHTIVYDVGLLVAALAGVCVHLIFAFVLHAVLRRTVDPV